MERNRSLDGARGLAALAVAFAHCNTHYTGAVNWAYRLSDFHNLDATQIILRLWHTVFNGDAAVVLFFVLSGFVLSRSLERQLDAPPRAFFPYVIRRVFRLYPAAIVAGAVAYCLYPITMTQMLGSMFLTSLIPNGVIWSLQVELVGSLVVFLMWAANSRLMLVAIIGVYAALWIFAPRQILIVPFQFILFPIAFVLGYAIPQMPIRLWAANWTLFFGLAVFLVSDLILGRNWHATTGQMLGALLIVGHLQYRTRPLLQTATCQFLGEVSYPFYLLHAMLAFAIKQPLDALLPYAPLLVKVPLLALVSIPVALAAAYAVSKLVELPGIRIGSTIVRSLRGLLAAPAVER